MTLEDFAEVKISLKIPGDADKQHGQTISARMPILDLRQDTQIPRTKLALRTTIAAGTMSARTAFEWNGKAWNPMKTPNQKAPTAIQYTTTTHGWRSHSVTSTAECNEHASRVALCNPSILQLATWDALSSYDKLRAGGRKPRTEKCPAPRRIATTGNGPHGAGRPL